MGAEHSAKKAPPGEAPAVVNGEICGVGPVDFRPLVSVRIPSESEIGLAVNRARFAQESWQGHSLGQRHAALRRAAKRMLDKRHEAVDLMRQEIGKLECDALMSEVLGPLDQVNAWAQVIKTALARHAVKLNPMSFPKKRAWYDLIPRGVVGIIAPWNYPVATYFRSVFPALLTGNAVVVKPSELTPRTAQWFARQLQAELPEDVLTVVPGGGDTGEALIGAGIDACVFTGSVKTGARVQRLCLELGIPVSAEMGGNDPAIVLTDCDLDRTTQGITHWALHNVGQACGAVELAYVDEQIADLFVDRLRRAWSKLRLGPGPFAEVDISPLACVGQLRTVEHHIKDALDKGASLICGGQATGEGLWFEPTILDHCRDDMLVINEETFGPVLAVVRVSGATDAIERANAARYGLTASIWSTDLPRAERLAERLDYGVVTINNHSLTGAIAGLPWSGTRATGYSVANSELALATFVRPRTILVDRATNPEPFWLPFDFDLWELGDILSDAQLTRLEKAWKLPLLLSKRVKRIRDFFR